jgi:hypothetical protein
VFDLLLFCDVKLNSYIWLNLGVVVMIVMVDCDCFVDRDGCECILL